MVSLSLTARLIEAVRLEAELALVGDPGQLTSIEAGAVLGDIVGLTSEGLRIGPTARERLPRVTGLEGPAGDPPSASPVGDGIVVLDRVHRFGGGIATVAEAVRRGDADAVVEALASAPERWGGSPRPSPTRMTRRLRPYTTALSPRAAR